MNQCSPRGRLIVSCFFLASMATLSRTSPCGGAVLHLESANVVTLAKSEAEKKAVAMLIDEVHKRTGIGWNSAAAWPGPFRRPGRQ